MNMYKPTCATWVLPEQVTFMRCSATWLGTACGESEVVSLTWNQVIYYCMLLIKHIVMSYYSKVGYLTVLISLCLKEKFVFLNLDLISGIKYVYLLTNNSLVKVSVLRKIFRLLEIRVYPYNGSEQGIDNTASK